MDALFPRFVLVASCCLVAAFHILFSAARTAPSTELHTYQTTKFAHTVHFVSSSLQNPRTTPSYKQHHRSQSGPAMDDYSDTTFQIPTAASSSSNLLLADESTDFLAGTDITLTTPAAATRTRLDNALTFAEVTPRARTTRMPVPLRRSPRKHKGTPAVPSPLKRVVERDLSVAMEDTLSPLKRQDRSFEIPAMTNDDSDLLMGDDVEQIMRNCGDSSFGETPAAAVHARETLTVSQMTSPPRAPSSPSTIRTLSALDEHIPETSTLAIPGSTGIHTDSLSPPHPTPPALLHLNAEVEALTQNTEQSRQPESSPRLPFIPSEETDVQLSSINAANDKADRDIFPEQDVPMDVLEPKPSAPAPLRRNPGKRASQAKTHSVSLD